MSHLSTLLNISTLSHKKGRFPPIGKYSTNGMFKYVYVDRYKGREWGKKINSVGKLSAVGLNVGDVVLWILITMYFISD